MFRTWIKASAVAIHQERSTEFALWKAVIAQAITDAKWTEATKDACVEATKKADDQ